MDALNIFYCTPKKGFKTNPWQTASYSSLQPQPLLRQLPLAALSQVGHQSRPSDLVAPQQLLCQGCPELQGVLPGGQKQGAIEGHSGGLMEKDHMANVWIKLVKTMVVGENETQPVFMEVVKWLLWISVSQKLILHRMLQSHRSNFVEVQRSTETAGIPLLRLSLARDEDSPSCFRFYCLFIDPCFRARWRVSHVIWIKPPTKAIPTSHIFQKVSPILLCQFRGETWNHTLVAPPAVVSFPSAGARPTARAASSPPLLAHWDRQYSPGVFDLSKLGFDFNPAAWHLKNALKMDMYYPHMSEDKDLPSPSTCCAPNKSKP